MFLGVLFRALIFLAAIWSAVVVVLSLLGDPFLFIPMSDSTALLPPLYRYETLRLTFFSLFAFFSLQQIFAPEKKFSPGRVLLIALVTLAYIGLIKVIPHGRLNKEAGVFLTIGLFAVVFYLVSRPKIKKIFGRR